MFRYLRCDVRQKYLCNGCLSIGLTYLLWLARPWAGQPSPALRAVHPTLSDLFYQSGLWYIVCYVLNGWVSGRSFFLPCNHRRIWIQKKIGPVFIGWILRTVERIKLFLKGDKWFKYSLDNGLMLHGPKLSVFYVVCQVYPLKAFSASRGGNFPILVSWNQFQ